MSTPSDSIATDASVVDDDVSIARRATDDFLSDAVSALRVSSREPARRVVLCPVVDDDASVDAVRWALRHLVRDGDALHILHVLPNRARDAFEYAYAPPSSAFAASPVPGTRDDDDDVAARRRLDRARARRFVRERFGDVNGHSDASRLLGSAQHGSHKGAELLASCGATPRRDDVGKHRGSDDACGDRIFEVVAYVGNTVSPRHNLTFGSGWCWPAP